MTTRKRVYSELAQLETFDERLEYLKIESEVARPNDAVERYIQQGFYRSTVWKSIRDRVIIRDFGCDLGVRDLPIISGLYVHHMNPITTAMITNGSPLVYEMRYLVTTSLDTHNTIHYRGSSGDGLPIGERRENDTRLW